MTTPVENLVTLFKNVHGNVNACLKTGETVSFIDGKFFTTNKNLQRHLQAAVDNEQEFGIFVDPEDAVIDTNAATPMEQLEKKLRAKIIAELAAGGQLVNAGTSHVSAAQAQSAISGTNFLPGASQEGAPEQVIDPATVQPEGGVILLNSQGAVQEQAPAPAASTTEPVSATTVEPTPALSALEKLKLGK